MWTGSRSTKLWHKKSSSKIDKASIWYFLFYSTLSVLIKQQPILKLENDFNSEQSKYYVSIDIRNVMICLVRLLYFETYYRDLNLLAY